MTLIGASADLGKLPSLHDEDTSVVQPGTKTTELATNDAGGPAATYLRDRVVRIMEFLSWGG